MDRDEGSEPEQVGLLITTNSILNRGVSQVEGRLIIIAFGFLCLSSIGFGLFAGELSKLEQTRNDGHHPELITTTITVPRVTPTSSPRPDNPICYSAPCIDASSELRKTIDWDADPCQDFDRFAMRRIERPAIDMITEDVDRSIEHLVSTHTLDPTILTLQEFHSTCTHTQDPNHELLAFLNHISIAWNFSHSRTIRITSALAYLHAHALPAFFTNDFTNRTLTIKPSSSNTIGIERAFEKIYPSDQRSRRAEGVRRLVRDLDQVNHPSHPFLLSIKELQALVCIDHPAPCLIEWREYYSSLSSKRLISEVVVDGIEFFKNLPSVVAAHSDETIESYFHWIAISSIIEPATSCSAQLRRFFGPLLSKHYLSTTSSGRDDLKHKLESVHLVLSSILNSTTGDPVEIIFPSVGDQQVDELAAVRKDQHVGNLLRLSQMKTRKSFEHREKDWDMLGPKINIELGQVHCPAGILQSPFVYPSPDVPISLTYGALGVWVAAQLAERGELLSHDNTSAETSKIFCRAVSEAFRSWKKDSRGRRKGTLAGLTSLKEEGLFFLAFSRLGTSIEPSEMVALPEFDQAFGCHRQ